MAETENSIGSLRYILTTVGTNGIRGSALIYVLLISMCASMTLLALISLAGAVNASEARREHSYRANLAMQGAVAAVRSQSNADTLTVPSTQTIAIDNINCTTTVTDNSSNIANSYKISVSASRWGRTYALIRVTGLPSSNSIYKYALFLNAGGIADGKLTTIDPGGHGSFYSNGPLVFNASGSSVQGNVDMTQSPSGGHTISATGTYKTNYSPTWAWPTLSDSTYSGAAHVTYGSDQSRTNVSFAGAYDLVYVTGNLTLAGGTITGTGTYYVLGNVSISGNYAYANGSSKLAVICKGTMTLSSGASNIVGIYFANGPLAYNTTTTINDGILLVNQNTNFNSTVSVTFDPDIKNVAGLGKNLHLPALWP